MAKLGIRHGKSCRFSCSYVSLMAITSDPHGHDVGTVAAHGPEGDPVNQDSEKNISDVDSFDYENGLGNAAAAQILGVAILEFGVILHRQVFSVVGLMYRY